MHSHSLECTKFVIRQAEDVDTLEPLLRLRYETYKKSDLAIYLKDNESGFDIDTWDQQAIHFGVWEESGALDQPVGYLRIIGLKPTTATSLVAQVVRAYPSLEKRIIRETTHPIRFMDLFEGIKSVEEWYQHIKIRSIPIVEASRLSVTRQYQVYNIGQHLVELALSLFLDETQGGFGAMEVMDHHLPFYQQYGFVALAQKNHPEIGRTSHLVVGHYSTLPAPFKRRMHAIQDSWKATGYLRFASLNKEDASFNK